MQNIASVLVLILLFIVANLAFMPEATAASSKASKPIVKVIQPPAKLTKPAPKVQAAQQDVKVTPAKVLPPQKITKQPVKLLTWNGVVTGIENQETFYLKQRYKYKYGEVTVKVSPETEFISKDPTAKDINDLEGGDYVEIKGKKLNAQTIQATTIKYINDQYKNR